MIRLFANANYDFIKWRRWAFSITGAIMLVGLAFLLTRGLNYSIEFTGGTLVQFEVAHKVPTSNIRAALDQVGLSGADIYNFGADTSYVVRARLGAEAAQGEAGTQAVADAVARALDQSVGAGQYRLARREAVGPKVGRELQSKATIAILISFLVTLIYLAIRFEWRFGLAAVVATAHDVLTTLAFIAILRLEVSLTVVAAILTVIGYSLNDTTIIFDRVREDLKKHRKETLRDTLNRAINETLPRSVLTHATALSATLALLFFGPESIRPFSWVMAFGIFTGTFSSIYVAGALLVWIERKWPRASSTDIRPTSSQGKAGRPPRPSTAGVGS